jgi:hypothetical protein
VTGGVRGAPNHGPCATFAPISTQPLQFLLLLLAGWVNRRQADVIDIGDQKYVFFDYTPNRSREGPLRILVDFEGLVQADAYSGYNVIFERDAVLYSLIASCDLAKVDAGA